MTTPSVAVYFVVEGRHLEAQAVLLAASLRHHTGDSYRLIAYRPAVSEAPEPAEATLAAFRAMEVDFRRFDVPEDAWKKPYPHGNKILASMAPRDEAGHVFLDTDMVCCAPIDFAALLAPGAVSMVPEGTPSWGKKNDRWERAYAHFGLPLPEDRVRLTRRKRIEFYPYFNAGLVAYRRDPAEERGFPALWYDTARDLDFNCKVALKRPWLDQIALPITLRRFGLDYRVLPAEVNFSISDRSFEPDAQPQLIHYHSFRYGPEWPQFRTEMDRMAVAYGSNLMQGLKDEFEDYWTPRADAA